MNVGCVAILSSSADNCNKAHACITLAYRRLGSHILLAPRIVFGAPIATHQTVIVNVVPRAWQAKEEAKLDSLTSPAADLSIL